MWPHPRRGTHSLFGCGHLEFANWPCFVRFLFHNQCYWWMRCNKDPYLRPLKGPGQQTVFCKWCFDCKGIQDMCDSESVKPGMLHLPVNGWTSGLKPRVMGDLEGPFYSPEKWNNYWTLPIFPHDKIILVYSAQCKFWWTDGMSWLVPLCTHIKHISVAV